MRKLVMDTQRLHSNERAQDLQPSDIVAYSKIFRVHRSNDEAVHVGDNSRKLAEDLTYLCTLDRKSERRLASMKKLNARTWGCTCKFMRLDQDSLSLSKYSIPKSRGVSICATKISKYSK